MARHTISHAEQLYRGDVFHPGYTPDGRRGVEMSHLYFYNPGAIEVLDLNGICTAAGNSAVTAAAGFVLDGALVTGGVATMTTPRTLVIDSSTTDTTQTATITGTDVYGEAMTEDIAFNGTTAVAGVKAFKTVTAIATDIDMVGNVDIGTQDGIGFPFVVSDLNNIIQITEDGITDASPAITVAVTTDPATATTGDVRGTWALTTASDGTVVYGVLMALSSSETKTGMFGVTQA